MLAAPRRRGGPPPLLDGLGTHHFPVTTRSAKAQAYVEPGHGDGLRLQPRRGDPRLRGGRAARSACAMAFWGIALALGPNYNLPIDPERARDGAATPSTRGMALARDASPRERAYIDALAKRYADGRRAATQGARPRLRGRDARGRAARTRRPRRGGALRRVADGAPSRGTCGRSTARRSPGTEEIVATLERVLEKAPTTRARTTTTSTPSRRRRTPSARSRAADRVARPRCPGAGHLVHMPSHIYMRVGRYADAADANENADRGRRGVHRRRRSRTASTR